jgi:hypothetical protein
MRANPRGNPASGTVVLIKPNVAPWHRAHRGHASRSSERDGGGPPTSACTSAVRRARDTLQCVGRGMPRGACRWRVQSSTSARAEADFGNRFQRIPNSARSIAKPECITCEILGCVKGVSECLTCNANVPREDRRSPRHVRQLGGSHDRILMLISSHGYCTAP